MILENKIFNTLKDSSSITAYVSTRIYPVMIPQRVATFPSIVYNRVSADRMYSLQGYTSCEKVRITIDIITNDYDTLRILGNLVHQVMTSSTYLNSCIMINEGDSYDPEYEIFLVNQIYSLIDITS